jgi:hypothetical protein
MPFSVEQFSCPGICNFLGHFEFRYQRADDVGSAVRCITGEQGIIHSDVAFYDLSAAISLGSRRE